MNSYTKKTFIFFLFFNFLFSSEIKVGMTADFSGSLSYLGKSMKKGIESYFNNYNKNSNNKYKLIVYNDMYDPLLTTKYVKKLIKEDDVSVILGSIGTPTANAILPIVKENKIPFVAPYSGGDVLRLRENEYVFNFRASYSQEAYSITKKLLSEGVNVNEIAVFSQNDTYGNSGYYGVRKAIMENKNLIISDLTHERYTSGTLNIELGLSKLLDLNNKYKAIIVVGSDEAIIKFIRYAKEDYRQVKFFLLSPTDNRKIARELFLFSEDIFITQVLPPFSSKDNIDIIKEFIKAYELTHNSKDYNITSFEGYLSAKLLVKAIQENKIINKEKIYNSLKKLREIDIGLGFKSDFNNPKSQYSDEIWICQFNDSYELTTVKDSIYKDE